MEATQAGAKRVRIVHDHDCGNPLEDWEHGCDYTISHNDGAWGRRPTTETHDSYGYLRKALKAHFSIRANRVAACRGEGESLTLALLEETGESESTVSGWLECSGYDADCSLVSLYESGVERATESASEVLELLQDEGLLQYGESSGGNRSQENTVYAYCPINPATHGEGLAQSVADTYGKWCDGEAYGFVIEQQCPCCGSWEHADSCWGFIGHEHAVLAAAEAAECDESDVIEAY